MSPANSDPGSSWAKDSTEQPETQVKQPPMNVWHVAGVVVCVFGFYGITKYALGFLFQQTPAFLVMMVVSILMYAMIVLAGIGLIKYGEHARNRTSQANSGFICTCVGLPAAVALISKLIVRFVIVPTL